MSANGSAFTAVAEIDNLAVTSRDWCPGTVTLAGETETFAPAELPMKAADRRYVIEPELLFSIVKLRTAQ